MSVHISILMSTDAQEHAERLARSLESMFSQTAAPEQLVLTLDGPVSEEQEHVVARYANDCRIGEVKVVRLTRHVGLGPALNAGLAACTGNWIMRMGSEDVSIPDRVAIQRDYLERHADLDVIGGWSEESFDNLPQIRINASPTSHRGIVAALKLRNVLVHPSMLLRADMLRAVSGYRGNFPLLEDWDLWVRLALANARFAVIPKILVKMLVSPDQASRRGRLEDLHTQMRFRTSCWMKGFIGFPQYIFGTAAYSAFWMAGPAIRSGFHDVMRIKAME